MQREPGGSERAVQCFGAVILRNAAVELGEEAAGFFAR